VICKSECKVFVKKRAGERFASGPSGFDSMLRTLLLELADQLSELAGEPEASPSDVVRAVGVLHHVYAKRMRRVSLSTREEKDESQQWAWAAIAAAADDHAFLRPLTVYVAGPLEALEPLVQCIQDEDNTAGENLLTADQAKMFLQCGLRVALELPHLRVLEVVEFQRDATREQLEVADVVL
jgi:hypothetical protein